MRNSVEPVLTEVETDFQDAGQLPLTLVSAQPHHSATMASSGPPVGPQATPPPTELTARSPAAHGGLGLAGFCTPPTFLDRVAEPVHGGLLPAPPRTKRTRTRRPPGSATRRSVRVQNRKLAYTGSGNATMRQARKLIISKKGMAIADKEEEEEATMDELLEKLTAAFDMPLTEAQMSALTALAKAGKKWAAA